MKTLKDVLAYLAEKDAPSEIRETIEQAQDVFQRLVEWEAFMGGFEAGGAFDTARGLLRGKAAVVVYDGKTHVCDNCQKTWEDEELAEIHDPVERIDPGGVVPSGECPECGALCYPVKGGA